MTGQWPLDWAVLAVSFCNTILLLWLGLTVLLNAARRSWGVWLAAGGLLAGAAFLVIHSALYANGWVRFSLGLSLAWVLGWMLVVALPFAWYLVVLWYAGYWDDATSALHRRQRPWLALTVLAALGLLGLLAFANPFPTYAHIVGYETAATRSLGDIPILGLAYPLYIVLCIARSIDVLLRPAPSGRMMGDLARRRARPWLVATSLALLAVSGLVGWVFTWVLLYIRQGATLEALTRMAGAVACFDLTIDLVLAAALLCLGQAVVSYEIFTGGALPRRGLRRQWRGVVVLAAGFGLLAAGSLSGALRAVTALLLAGGLVTLFYALLGRQSFVERERYIEHLRPLLASQRLYEHLRADTPAGAPGGRSADTPFHAMCADLLGARVAYLAALGPLAPLAGQPVSYPADLTLPAAALPSLVAQLTSPAPLCVPVDPHTYGGATWAVPLWSGGGLVGVVLLGEKRDGGLYTQEEIEIARAGGERLLDTQATAELARRLMALQRHRLAESRVLDGQARRTLHDDVLPRLHTAILDLSSAAPPARQQEELHQPGPTGRQRPESDAVELLADVHRRISNLLHDMPLPTVPALERLGLVGALRQLLAGELAGAFDELAWQVEPQAEAEAQALPPPVAEVLYYAAREALRNAARHGRGNENSRSLRLTIVVLRRDGLVIRIEDNGVGVQAHLPAAGSTHGPVGGHGLALHSTMMAVIGGSLAVESLEQTYTRVSLLLPAAAYAPPA